MWLLILILTHTLVGTFSCPTACICKWKGGKQTVECTNRDLITIPDGMDHGTQVLEFSGNNLKTLPKERFQKIGLINLQRIYLSRCRLTNIDDKAFKGLSNLVELDLSENLLTSVPTETFGDYQALMRLILNHNPISTLQKNSFRHLSYLTNLEISNCEIELVHDEAFVGLDNLEWLKLDGNRLSTIRGNHILPDSLHGIDLTKNNWQCDCKMLDLHNWLHNFNNIPHTVEPKCSGPPRINGKTIRSIEVEDLACLPDVSPTTLYLEIAEGKNVSLLCKVTAVPEAHVSWWFQGQVLQNDTIIAPGLHLYYYIEEGHEEKKSELFIYNTNTDDNGTFICVAENSAGKSASNFTIRIIVKEEPIVILVSFPFEYFLAVVAGAAVLILVLIITIIVSIVRCRKNRRKRRKKERSKEVALHNQTTTTKCSVIRETEPPEPVKVNGNALIVEREQEMIIFSSTTEEEIINSVTSVACANQYCSPPNSRIYQEQNPDLINDTESVGKGRRREGDGEDKEQIQEEAMDEFETVTQPIRQVQWQDLQFPTVAVASRIGNRDLYHTADVHLSPGCLIPEGEGYPVDYGLPKVMALRPQLSVDSGSNFYRTLPHNRAKRLSAANPITRFSREAEFLSRTNQPPSFEHYCPQDVRYTVDGYPRSAQKVYPNPSGNYSENNFIPSPPEGYKTESPASLPCCPSQDVPSGSAGLWPQCLPANPKTSHESLNRFGSISKRCSVGAQTETQNANQEEKNKPSSSNTICETLTESPDEGYVGENAEM